MQQTKLSPERKKSLRKLAKLMNKQNAQPLPITNDLLKCFDVAISHDETDFLLKLELESHTYKEIMEISGLSEKQFKPFIRNILKKGLLSLGDTKDEKEKYVLSAILVGWFEIYLSDGEESEVKREFAKHFEKYTRFMGIRNFFPLRNYLNYKFKQNATPIVRVVVPTKSKGKTIEINKKMDVGPVNIYPSKDVTGLIEKYGGKNEIAVIHCFCRQSRKMVGKPCKLNLAGESCIIIGKAARQVVEYKIGRYISKEEALTLIEEVQKKGAIHQVFHKKQEISLPEMAICNCCWDCCGVLAGYNKGLFPLCLRSYYCAVLPDNSACVSCKKCEKYCPVSAISFKDNKCTINADVCIGCGQCVLKCPQEIIQLEENERDVILPMQKKSKLRIHE